MICKTQIQIPEDVYRHSLPIIRRLRAVGIFPLTTKKSPEGLFLKWSPCYAIYSYVIAILFVMAAYYGQVIDLFESGESSIYSLYETDKFVMLLCVSSYSLVVFSGALVTRGRCSDFFAYLTCLNEVDSIIETHLTRRDQNVSVALLNFLICYNLVAGLVDYYYCYTLMRNATSAFVILTIQGGLVLVTGVAVNVDYSNRHLVHGLTLRISRLNLLLGQEHDNLQKTIFRKARQPWPKNKRPGCLNSAASLIKLKKAYAKLMDAAVILSDLLGRNILVALLSILFLLVVNGYLFILAVEGKRTGWTELVDIIFFLSMQIIRLLLFTEPCYHCLVELKQTQKLVCRLVSTKTDANYRREARSFALALHLRQFAFSGCGFFEVDRLLFSSLIGATTTYIVILLKYQEDGGLT